MITYSPNRRRVLGLLGIIWVLSAYGVAVAPLTRLGLPIEILPVWTRVGLWLGPGVLALVSATFWRRLDAWAWGLLILPIALYAVSFLFGWIVFLLPGDDGFGAGWRGAAVYIALGFLIFYCAKGLDRVSEPKKKKGGGSWVPKDGSQL